MKAVTIKGVAMLRVDKFGVYINHKEIGTIIRDAMQPTESELEKFELIPARIYISVDPIKTELEIEHPGEPKLMEPVELEMKKVS
jgi:hypothetical protein